MNQDEMPFKDMLTFFNGDSSYGKAAIIAPLHRYGKLVGILRMRGGMKVWTCHKGGQKDSGARRVYGKKYYLRETDKEVTDKKSGNSFPLGLLRYFLSKRQNPDQQYEHKHKTQGRTQQYRDIFRGVCLRMPKPAGTEPIEHEHVREIDAKTRR